jgi:hypothetical protein
MRLLWLAPQIEEVVLDGRVDLLVGEGSLRALAAIPLWANQLRAWGPGPRGVANP